MENKTITQMLKNAREEVCSKLCKYPERYTADEWEEQFEEICKDCPLDILQEQNNRRGGREK